jgi:hypothetical protein
MTIIRLSFALIFYGLAVVKEDYYMKHLLSSANVFREAAVCKIHRYIAAVSVAKVKTLPRDLNLSRRVSCTW